MDNYHLSPSADGWELKKAGAERASKKAATKQELMNALTDFFDGKTASVKIHRADGSIEEERTYPRSADPRRSKG
ncbi:MULTISPECIES: DUF2188 domain-containing protein [unclassified Pseudomonas]|uniref:DUF2188 domain-containing protein n=1 Tax=unclassified Pseudomonas TaxID=196821 RepID=UPI001199DDE9|nr:MULTISPECIES: DUF2188 domain-containing protein [unclassified Pseudomonas]TWC22867.1 uncharacterized protein DUF2188 [Pseudomonas sp. SJZ075]TWC24869.1 uncharacterized protein DUF2188 [Pseudomonas sp. SJZ074]TWC38253.1 uncharacterized protein DUF2188 [Pseudomonas sp. SJZ078]TWC40914.1 uncharacterized protein DUF2188 [Pseudomonas sp. SJZ085]TWC58843.1 uncharacterized protein DUF2188 [Pseudomonas sp. SJZ124]